MRIKNLAGVTTRDSFNIPPAHIQFEEGYNVRTFNLAREEDARLMESIRQNGVTEPIKVRADGDRLLVVSGHRRMAAVFALIASGHAIASVPAVAMKRDASPLDLVYDLATSNSGEPVAGMALAEVFFRARCLGETEQDISARLGYSIVHVRVMLALHSAPPVIRDMVAAGVVSATFAGETLQAAATPEDAVATLQAAVAYAADQGKTRVTAKHVKAVRAVRVVAHRRAAAGDGELQDAPRFSHSKRSIFDSEQLVAVAETIALAAQMVALLNRS